MIADHQLVLGGELAEPFRLADRDLTRNGACTEGLGKIEAVVGHIVGHSVDAVELHDLDVHAGVLVLLAKLRKLRHGCGKAPLLECFGSGTPSGLLFRSGIAAGGRNHGCTVKLLHGLRAQLHGTQAKLEYVFQDALCVRWHPVETVRRVDTDLNAAPL